MSRFHPLCPATGGGGAHSPWKVSRSQPAFHAVPSQAEPSLGLPQIPGSSESSAAASHCNYPGLCLVLQHWDELGKGKGRNKSRRAWRAGVGAGGTEICSWGL